MEVLSVVSSPVRAMERVGENRKAALGFGVVLVWALVSLVSAIILVFTGFDVEQITSGIQDVPEEAVEGAVAATQIAVPVFSALYPFVWWALISLVMHLITRFFGGNGPLSGTFAVVGLACVPIVIYSVISVLITGLQAAVGLQSGVAGALGALNFLLVFAAIAWHVALVVIGASFARQVSYGRSGGSCAISCVGLVGLVVGFFVVLGIIIALASGGAGA